MPRAGRWVSIPKAVQPQRGGTKGRGSAFLRARLRTNAEGLLCHTKSTSPG